MLRSLSLLCLCISFCCIEGDKKQKHAVPTYFRRLNDDGTLIDRTDVVLFNEIFEAQTVHEYPSSENDQSCVIKATPFLLENGESATVSWHGVSQPNRNDWVGLFCPENSSAKGVLDHFKPSLMTVFTWDKGYGSYNVILYNMRTHCEFRYYNVQGNHTFMECSSNIVSFVGGNEQPLQGHIALTGKSSEMRVMWTSSLVKKPIVKYGVKRSLLTETVSASAKTYLASDMCGSPANTTAAYRDPGYMYDALLTDLKPGKRYFYSYGTTDKMSSVFNFTTALPAGDPTSYNFILYGDMGISAYPRAAGTAERMVEEYQEEDVKFIFHNGDISYARGYGYIWDQWHTLIEPYATLIPYMVGIGNHEQDHTSGASKDPSGAGAGFHPKWGDLGDDSSGECGVPMFNRFHMPDNGNYLWWYSYDYGLVHYIMMSTEHDYSSESRQYKWLENDLKSVDRKKTPWVLLGGHRAMYASQDEMGDYDMSLGMQRLFEDLLLKYSVDLAIWAHYHSYERTCKVYKQKCVDNGITHIVVGTAGKSLDNEKWLGKDWSVSRNLYYGYVRGTVINSTAMHFQHIRNRDKVAADDFWLYK